MNFREGDIKYPYCFKAEHVFSYENNKRYYFVYTFLYNEITKKKLFCYHFHKIFILNDNIVYLN